MDSCRFLLELFKFNNAIVMQGIVEKITDKGFGFIKHEDHEKGIFFHATSLEGVDYNDLNEGDKVEFELTETPRGLNASNVTLVTE